MKHVDMATTLRREPSDRKKVVQLTSQYCNSLKITLIVDRAAGIYRQQNTWCTPATLSLKNFYNNESRVHVVYVQVCTAMWTCHTKRVCMSVYAAKRR